MNKLVSCAQSCHASLSGAEILSKEECLNNCEEMNEKKSCDYKFGEQSLHLCGSCDDIDKSGKCAVVSLIVT